MQLLSMHLVLANPTLKLCKPDSLALARPLGLASAFSTCSRQLQSDSVLSSTSWRACLMTRPACPLICRIAWSSPLPQGTASQSMTHRLEHLFMHIGHAMSNTLALHGQNMICHSVAVSQECVSVQNYPSEGLRSCFPRATIFFIKLPTLSQGQLSTLQSVTPLLVLGGLHLEVITDLAWSPDGRHLAISSYDCYCRFAHLIPLPSPSPEPVVLIARASTFREHSLERSFLKGC